MSARLECSLKVNTCSNRTYGSAADAAASSDDEDDEDVDDNDNVDDGASSG